MSANAARILVYGGKGALGNACVQLLSRHGYTVDSVDFAANQAAHANVIVAEAAKMEEQAENVLTGVAQLLGNESKLKAVLCVAGGWQGGSARAESFIRSCDAMWKQSVWSSTIAARVASRFLAEDGSLILIGANAAFDPTPTMIGYGMAKAAVHHLARSLAAEKSGLPPRTFVAALCPVTLDTPANRTSMPKANTSTWTPLDIVSDRIRDWVEGRERPANGSLVRIQTKDGQTEFIVDN